MSIAYPVIEVARSYEWSGLRLEETVYPGGLHYPRHIHEPAYLAFFLAGALTEQYVARASAFVASTVVYHPPGEEHAFRIAEKGLRALTVELPSEWLQRLMEGEAAFPHRVSSVGGPLAALGRQLARELQAPDPYARLAIEGLVLEVLAGMFRVAAGPEERQAPSWLRRAVALLREQFRENPRLETVAAEVGVHPVHLCRTFGRYYHCTPGEYVRQLRIAYACEALARSETPLAEIALQAGFADQSQLCRMVRAHTGLTPAAYRRAHQGSR